MMQHSAARPGQGRARYERRRGEIVDAAAELFANKGYHGTSMNDLTAATGLQRGALYHYIDGKEDLLYLIHERFLGPLLDEVKVIAEDDFSALEALREISRAILRTITDYRSHVTVFLHEWRTIVDDARWGAIKRSRRELSDQVEGILRRGVEEGTLRIEDIPLAALAYFGMVNYSYQWLDVGGRRSAVDVADYFTDIFISGVAAR